MHINISFLRDCDKDDEITRDYLEGIEAQDDKNRESLKNIWMEADMTDEDWHQVEPDEEYFLVSATIIIKILGT